MLRRLVLIWALHSLAFVVGLVVSGVVAGGLLTLVPSDGGKTVELGLALAVAILSMGVGYALYLAIIGLLLNQSLGWAFYLAGPFVVLGVMGAVFSMVFWTVLSVLQGGVALYLMLFVIGGIALSVVARRGPEAAQGGGPDPEKDPEKDPERGAAP